MKEANDAIKYSLAIAIVLFGIGVLYQAIKSPTESSLYFRQKMYDYCSTIDRSSSEKIEEIEHRIHVIQEVIRSSEMFTDYNFNTASKYISPNQQ